LNWEAYNAFEKIIFIIGFIATCAIIGAVVGAAYYWIDTHILSQKEGGD